ncbi:hypothetical protein [Micromonospora sp. NPDC050200]
MLDLAKGESALPAFGEDFTENARDGRGETPSLAPAVAPPGWLTV